MNILAQTKSRPEWLRERRKGLGGSDAAAVLGISTYKGPVDVYAEKLGLVQETDESEAMEWGRILEEPIAVKYRTLTNCRYTRLNGRTIFQHPTLPWMLASPDRLLMHKNRGLEVKTAGHRQAARWGEEGTDSIPEEYLIQCAHYMAVLDKDAWDVAVLIGGQEFRTYTIRRDRDLEEMIIEREKAFWEHHVVPNSPPEDTPEKVKAFLSAKFPKPSNADLLAWEGGKASLILQLREARILADKADAHKIASENLVKNQIGDALGCTSQYGKVTWKNNKDSDVTDWKAVAYELMRLAKDQIGSEADKAITDIIAHGTTTKPGPRVFRCSFTGEKESA